MRKNSSFETVLKAKNDQYTKDILLPTQKEEEFPVIDNYVDKQPPLKC